MKLLATLGSCFVVGLALFGCSKKEPAPEPAATSEPAAAASSAAAPAPEPTGPALKIAYSDWPGWVAWDIGIQKGWFKEAGVAVDFSWFEYVPSMDAFAAGQVDAVAMTNGDALVTGSTGAKSVAILLNDYSNGNDMVVAKPGIKSVKDLKGKKIGVEVGFVSHLLLLKALESAGLKESDVTLVNMPTDQTPQALGDGAVDAIVAWQPNSGQALKALPGSKAIYTSANAPGIIYDVLAVSPKSLAARRADWKKVVKVWFRIADYVSDPKNSAEVTKIMGARVGLSGPEYAGLMKGTYFLGKEGNLKHFKKGKDLTSVFYSNTVVDKFNLDFEVYGTSEDLPLYLDPSLVMELAK
jgi:NitT/TauT family transport system substrate-binding protein